MWCTQYQQINPNLQWQTFISQLNNEITNTDIWNEELLTSSLEHWRTWIKCAQKQFPICDTKLTVHGFFLCVYMITILTETITLIYIYIKNHPDLVSASAAGPGLFLRRLPVSNPEGGVLGWRVHQGGSPLFLQIHSHSDHYVLYLVLLVAHLSVGATAWARGGRVFGGGFKEHHVASFGKTQRPLLAHLGVRAAGVAEVTLITHQEPEDETETLTRRRFRNAAPNI